jgi:hypothetical protein
MVGVGLHVRITMTGGVHLYRYTKGGLDYSSVEQFLTLREFVPPHIRVWLDLIRQRRQDWLDQR